MSCTHLHRLCQTVQSPKLHWDKSGRTGQCPKVGMKEGGETGREGRGRGKGYKEGGKREGGGRGRGDREGWEREGKGGGGEREREGIRD